MKKFLLAAAFVLAAFVLAASPAFAHAHLDHASPAVGATVAAPSELSLSFSENLVAALSGATLAAENGANVPTGKATLDGADPATLHVPIGAKLKAGVYVVNWHAVAVDTHRTSGSYKFTVAP